MEVIPVLDLRGGCAVHARGGDRARYAVVQGAFGSGAEPVALARRMLESLGCHTLYVADLDAITGAEGLSPWVRALAGIGTELLVDAGVRDAAAAQTVLEAGATQVVVGLETLRDMRDLAAIVAALGAGRVVFGLDLRAGRPVTMIPELARLNAIEIARQAADRGVERILCLDLARVGSAAGAVVESVAAIRRRLPQVPLLAGGGVRSLADLEALAALGCSGALVATALHGGAITRADLDRLRATPGTGASAP